MWIGIVVALAASVFVVAKPQISSLTKSSLNTVSKVVNPSNSDNGGSTVTKIDSNDPKWVEKGNYGTNGYFVRDKDGNGIVYAIDPQQPVIAPETATFTKGNGNLTSLRFLDKTILPKNCNYYFANNSNLTTFDTKNLDTSNVTDMYGMFMYARALTALDVSNFNTSNVTNMAYMFKGTSALKTLDVSKFDTSNVTDMSNMFARMYALTSLDVSKFDMSKVTNVDEMFSGTNALITHKLG
ncbi:BspA family leucine-rich repeat surface protein [Anaerotruncus sp. X29]|nr:BspA family leucine-rich repeat surface protein [Anaerotruncus sp. X29]